MKTNTFKLSDIKDIKKICSLPIVIKGIMSPEDAIEVLEEGADAIWVSNNGGRIVDTTPSTISVLRAITKAVRSHKTKSSAEIYFDGGVRRGTDALKAIAYGANAVFIGRPAIWGLVKGGKEGVKEVLEMINEEMKLAMVLTHTMSVKEITEEQVIHMVKPKL